MKRKLTAGLFALITALAMTGCGEIEDDASRDDTSRAETTSIAESSSLTESSPDSRGGLGDTQPKETSSDSSAIELTLNTYSGDQIPQELNDTIMRTLAGAAGEYSLFENMFDPDLLIEARLRTALSDPDQIAATRSQFDDEARQKTTRQNYDILHGVLAGAEFTSLPENVKIQSLNGDIDSSILFSLSFDVKTDKGDMTFLGSAYRVDGIWGAVFEPGKHTTEEDLINWGGKESK